VDIQRESATAWITLAEGKREEAVKQMRAAAEHEDSTDKNNVTPGVILPAREQLGEMLLELKQPAQAVVEFEATLRTAPHRFNALSGAARAAKQSGDDAKAKAYYAELLPCASMPTETGRPSGRPFALGPGMTGARVITANRSVLLWAHCRSPGNNPESHKLSGQVLVNAAGSTVDANTIQCIDSTLLARQNHHVWLYPVNTQPEQRSGWSKP